MLRLTPLHGVNAMPVAQLNNLLRNVEINVYQNLNFGVVSMYFKDADSEYEVGFSKLSQIYYSWFFENL